MRKVISVSFPEKMASELDKAAKERRKSKSDLIKDALRAYLWEERFKDEKKTISTKAKARGMVVDEDVFKVIS
ncbi:MAG: CopG family ribbon-helix-helix protein [Candidatus Aminicenantaceae bacterium]